MQSELKKTQTKLAQKTIGIYFSEYKIPDIHKEKLIPVITELVYDRNMTIVKIEKAENQEEKNNLMEELSDQEKAIELVIVKFKKENNIN